MRKNKTQVLKFSKDKDFSELEKYGFVKSYSTKTGELHSYAIERKDGESYSFLRAEVYIKDRGILGNFGYTLLYDLIVNELLVKEDWY
jgi:hypothetical protein